MPRSAKRHRRLPVLQPERRCSEKDRLAVRREVEGAVAEHGPGASERRPVVPAAGGLAEPKEQTELILKEYGEVASPESVAERTVLPSTVCESRGAEEVSSQSGVVDPWRRKPSTQTTTGAGHRRWLSS